MATKTKTSETSAPAPVSPVEKLFSEGLEHLNAGELVAAAAAFTQVQAEAMSQERLNLGRTARGYLTAIEARLHEQDAPSKETAELSAQLLLNRKNPEAALEALDKALKASPERGALHYLKAVAHAQLGQVQESADALAKAAEFDADVLFQFRLEPDFDGIRHSGSFAALLRG
jgi:tetratricopeptide (TPR) repeat protein